MHPTIRGSHQSFRSENPERTRVGRREVALFSAMGVVMAVLRPLIVHLCQLPIDNSTIIYLIVIFKYALAIYMYTHILTLFVLSIILDTMLLRAHPD